MWQGANFGFVSIFISLGQGEVRTLRAILKN